MSLRWGVLGPGGIAHKMTADLLEAGLNVRAVGSRSLAKSQEFAAQYAIPIAYGSYEELVADPQVDIVYIATPHAFHHANAMLALGAGKHVLVEKAFTLNAAQAQEVAALANERGLLALEAMWTRFLPHMVQVRQTIADGGIGQVKAVIADHSQKLSDDPNHRLNAPELGGGALLDLGVYPVSLAHDILGKPATITAAGQLKDTGVDAHVGMTFTYAGGATASLFTASDASGANTATILGTEGRIEIGHYWFTNAPVRIYNAAGEMVREFQAVVPGRGMQYQAFEAERLISQGNTDSQILPVAESVEIMAVMDEVRRQLGVRYPGE